MARSGTNHKGGRPKGSIGPTAIKIVEARKFLVEEIKKDLEPIVLAQKEAAKGLWYEEISNTGKKRVYQREPDLKTGEFLINQVAGKPKETLEMEGGIAIKLDVL